MEVPKTESRPSRAELNEYSKKVPEWAKKRAETAEWIADYRQEVRELEEKDPQEAAEYRRKFLPPKKIIEKFYADVEKDYKILPLEKEEIEELFSAEHLSSLSLEDYTELLKKVPPRFVTHVSRHGVRDHYSHHFGGYGEFHHSGQRLLDSNGLVSIADQYLEDGIAKDTIKAVIDNQIKIPEDADKEKARDLIEEYLTQSQQAPASSKFADSKAVHVALDHVADDYYGGERKNEIFMVYPSAFVAANYYIGGQRYEVPEGYDADRIKTDKFNDFWLLNKDEKRGELPMDAGIVFIPRDTLVSKETGSRYETNENFEPAIDKQSQEALIKVLGSPEFELIQEDAEDAHRNMHNLKADAAELREKAGQQRITEGHSDGYSYKADELEKQADQMEAEIQEHIEKLRPLFDLFLEAGLHNEQFYKAFGEQQSSGTYAYSGIKSLLGSRKSTREKIWFQGDKFDDEFDDILANIGIKWESAKDTVTAQEYWEEHFKKTGKRPSKIIFYEESKPNDALEAFKQKAGLTKDGAHQSIDLKKMFQETEVGQKGIKEVLAPESELFMRFAEEILEEMYPKK